MADAIICNPLVRLIPQWDGRWGARFVHDAEKWQGSGCHPSSVALILRWHAEDSPNRGSFKFPRVDGTTIPAEHYGRLMCEAFWPDLKGEVSASSNTTNHTALVNKAADALGMDHDEILLLLSGEAVIEDAGERATLGPESAVFLDSEGSATFRAVTDCRYAVAGAHPVLHQH